MIVVPFFDFCSNDGKIRASWPLQAEGRCAKKPRRVPPSADGGIKYSLFFPATCASEKTLLSLQTCGSGTQTNPLRWVCLGEEGQGSGAIPGRQARMSIADFAPTKCDAAGCGSFEHTLAYARLPSPEGAEHLLHRLLQGLPPHRHSAVGIGFIEGGPVGVDVG